MKKILSLLNAIIAGYIIFLGYRARKYVKEQTTPLWIHDEKLFISQMVIASLLFLIHLGIGIFKK